MSRINTNIEAIRSLSRLNTNQNELALRLERLSTGLRINRGKDDPAGLIASERMRSEIVGIKAATANSQRTINVLSVTEAALGEVSALLTDLRSLVTNSSNESGLSPDEVAANQLQVDSILESINRIANTTQFAGRKLLDGTLAYQLTGQVTSQVAHVDIFAARLPDSGNVTVSVDIATSAQRAILGFNNGAALPLGSGQTVEISGTLGTETISFASGTAMSAMVAAVNSFASLTGVTAALSGTSAIVLNSSKFGSDEFVSVRSLNGNFFGTPNAAPTRDEGLDPSVLINGQQAKANGLETTIRTTAIDLELSLASTFATQITDSTTFTITGGGARFQISPFLTGAGRVDLGIPTISVSNLGNSVDGFLSSLKTGQANEFANRNFQVGETIVNEAINQVATMRGRLGAFQKNTVETNMNSMQVAMENVTAAESILRDADMAQEVSKLTLAQILVQSSIQTLAIANQTPSNILQLIG